MTDPLLSASDAEGTYLAQLSKGQAACLRALRELAAERAAVDVTEVPYFDTECRAIYGLRALGAALLDAKSPTKPPVATGLRPLPSPPSKKACELWVFARAVY